MPKKTPSGRDKAATRVAHLIIEIETLSGKLRENAQDMTALQELTSTLKFKADDLGCAALAMAIYNTQKLENRVYTRKTK